MTFLMMGLNLWAALIVMLIVVMILIHMIGCMSIAGINANAVSLVNLVMVSSATSLSGLLSHSVLVCVSV